MHALLIANSSLIGKKPGQSGESASERCRGLSIRKAQYNSLCPSIPAIASDMRFRWTIAISQEATSEVLIGGGGGGGTLSFQRQANITTTPLPSILQVRSCALVLPARQRQPRSRALDGLATSTRATMRNRNPQHADSCPIAAK